ncbi:putative peptidase [Lachnellula hyalina]|uniref:Putative peptidase n=1 Tax=Lachnellula hyalina TaxID=1316788 RepID=A0A8H8U0B9_9HELO|nr:putative peptidase [Lachnellula hyalina]TVY25886.1 putative peptidase [Lachnellula hyalina]
MFSHKILPPGASSIEKSLLKGFDTRAYRLPGEKFGGFQRRVKLCLAIAVLSVSAWFLARSKYNYTLEIHAVPWSQPHSINQFQQCSITNFLSTGLPFLKSAAPLPVEEYVQRRNNLAKALVADNVDAFIVEPGYTFQYYANISQKDWEVWEPEERPFLMVIRPITNLKTGDIEASTVFLAPSFEVERARLLGMPFQETLTFVPWEEHWNPYDTLRNSWEDEFIIGGDLTVQNIVPKVMVDEEMRDFIQRGLSANGFDVVGLDGEVERVKQTKSPREIEIVRAVNTGTVVAVRATRDCMYPGLTENEVMDVLDNTLRAAGMEPFFDIVLFDENASNPHGGTNGIKVLEKETFVLIDVGAHLYGYSSDICRTFFPPFFPKPTNDSEVRALSPVVQEKLKVWDIVLEAQTQSMHALVSGNTAASVDIAARKVISDGGYGNAFTHRVGHGIGIKAHESPYLNKGNFNVTLRAGMTFTSEPGIYLVDKFGVRHEDILLVKEDGEPEILTGQRAVGPWDP